VESSSHDSIYGTILIFAWWDKVNVKVPPCMPCGHTEGVEIQLTLLTSALECVKWSPSHIGYFIPKWKGSHHTYWTGDWVSPRAVRTFGKREKPVGPTGNPSSFLNHPSFNLVIIPSTLMQVVRKMMRNLSHSRLSCRWSLKWAPFKHMLDVWLHEPTCPKKTSYLMRWDDSYDWWLHMFR